MTEAAPAAATSVFDAGPAPSWLAAIDPAVPVRVRPSPLVPGLCTLAAGTGWLVVVALGFAGLKPWWVAFALVAGLGGLALALRGAPVVGLVPVVAGGVGWGFALGGHGSGFVGGLGLVGWNVAYAVPLLVAYGLAVSTDARRLGWARVRAGALACRWWGPPDRRLALLEVVPSARFVAVGEGTWLAVAGRRAALVRAVAWPGGGYDVDGGGEVRHAGQRFAPGCDGYVGVAADLRDWAGVLGATGAEVQAFLVVSAADGGVVTLRAPGGRAVRVVVVGDLVEVVGEHLATEPHRLDVAVLSSVDSRCALFGRR